MKTKNLMAAFALSAMFAACSQDAELNEAIAKNDFSNIPMVEAEFTANVGAESRMANQFGWETGDKVGLAWLGAGTDMLNKNLSTDGGVAYQNHPLFCVDANNKAFKTETMLYVGQYFAYMPYTEGNMNIENIKFDIAKQPLTANSNDLAKQAIYLSTENTTLEKANADGKVSEGSQKAGMGNNVKLKMALLTNPATIKFNFKDIADLTGLKVSKVEIALMDQSVSAGTIMPVKFAYNGFTPDFTKYTNADFWTWNGYTRGNVTLEGELEVANNALTTYALLLPAMTTSASPYYEINLTTNYGPIKATNVKVDNAKIFNGFGQVATITADVEGKNIKQTAAEVKTQAELNEVLNKLTALKQTEAATITLNPATAASPKAAFVLTDFTLPANLKSVVTLTAGGKTNGTIEFAGNTVINKQIVVTSPINVKGNMTVAHIANKTTLNCVNLTVDHDAVLTNNGIISGSIKTVAADEEEELGFGKYISNYKNAALINACEIENYGEAQWIAGTVPTVVTGTNNVYAEVTNLAGIKAASTAGVTFVRLMDGAAIYNQTEDYNYSNIGEIECYGDVTFYITDTPSGVTKSISFWANVEMTVKEGAVVNVGSDNKNNALNIHTIKVEEGALFNANNIILPATINNAGGVSLYNVKAFVKGTQAEGSSWSAQESN